MEGILRTLLSIVISLLAVNFSWTFAGEITLKNGTVIKGKPLPVKGMNFRASQMNSGGPTEVYPYWMIDDEMRRYFIPTRYAANVVQGAEPASFEEYLITQVAAGRKFTIDRVGGLFNISAFSEHARRTVSLNTHQGKLDIVQGITKLTPERATITSLTHLWEFQIATSSIPANDILTILHKNTDPKNTDQRLKMIRFLINASQYLRAQEEIARMLKDFPDMQERLNSLSISLRQLQAEQLANELTLRHQAGQYQLVLNSIQEFPRVDVSASILRKVDDISTDYKTKLEQAEKVRSLLREYEMQLDDSSEKDALAWMRQSLLEELDYDTIDRMIFFLRSENDPEYKSREKLALAYSSFILGNENADSDLKQAIRSWETRRWIQEYLQTINANERQLLLSRIQQQEGVGVKTINALLNYLPPQLPVKLNSGQSRFTITVPETTPAITYHVQLPIQYHHSHKYPVLVVLREGYRKPGEELSWWAGSEDRPSQAQRHGYIVIEPEYLEANDPKYNYNAFSHQAVLSSLIDLSKRFNIDRKRIYLGGHGRGGDACYDLGLSHPDIFAGVIPITGTLESYSTHLWNNAPGLGWYVIMGEYDGDSVELNAGELNKFYRQLTDIISVIYIARGREDYYEEIHKIFDWLPKQELRNPRDFETKYMRSFEKRHYWVEVDDLPDAKVQVTTEGRVIGKSLEVSGKLTLGNTIYVKTPGKAISIYLNPDMVSFEKRVEIYINGVRKYNDIPEFNLETVLEDLRLNGTLYPRCWVKLAF